VGKGSGSGAGRGSPGAPKLGTRFVSAADLAGAEDLLGGSGMSEIRVEKQMQLLESGQAKANLVKVSVTPGGRVVVDDGRHRIEAARRLAALGRPVKLRVRFSRGSKALDKP
jgi:hypothetical protein